MMCMLEECKREASHYLVIHEHLLVPVCLWDARISEDLGHEVREMRRRDEGSR